jgi:hypothetical protein
VVDDRDRLERAYRERVDAYEGVDDDFRDRWQAWCRTLLAHGGDLVVPPMTPEPDLAALLAGATVQPSPVAELDLGGNCHANVAKLWIEGGAAGIGTGYGLIDGLWRQHSWAVDADGALRETKKRHERYVGMTLARGARTVRFALSNYEGDVRAVLRSGSARAQEIIRVLDTVRDRRS